MFEAMTYDVILSNMMARIPDSFDKSEGSVIYDALAPCAVELANAYIEMDAVLDETFVDTASINYLAKRVQERGLSQILATKCISKLETTPDEVVVPVGSRFSCGNYNYTVIEQLDDGYEVECEESGSLPNSTLGQAIPIDYIEGLETATISEVLIPARDDETADELRKRYIESLSSQAFGGNVADYVAKTKAITGVGGVKVVPTWNGGGTVKVIITDVEFTPASNVLINNVQNALDPVGHGGDGLGLAPIGHVVTVASASSVTVDITATITYETGWSWESAGEYIKAEIDKYFDELNHEWDSSDQLVVRISVLESRILNATGVVDITGTTLNGTAANLVVDSDELVERGTVNG